MDSFYGRSGDNPCANDGYFGSDLHRLSHDLRTPLNYINGFAELLLLDQSLSPANADYVRAILSGSETLKAAVFSYLDGAQAAAPAIMPRTHPGARPKARHETKRWTRRSARLTASVPDLKSASGLDHHERYR